MIKLLTTICLCVGVSMVSSQCSNTASLRTLYGFSNSVTTPTTQSGLKYCKSLQNTQVCCTASDINSLQDKSNALLTNLTNAVTTRDKYFKQANVNVIGQLQTAITNFANTVNSFVTISSQPSSDPNVQVNNQEILTNLQGIQAGAGTYLASYATMMAAVQTNLQAFQSARTTCVVQIVKLQNAAWCLSCDPNAATKGYNPTTEDLAVSTNTCNKLKAACYPFVSTSFFQGGPIAIQELIGEMNQFTQLVTKIQSGTVVKAEDFDYVSTNPPSAAPPEECTQANCNWICDELFDNGVINQADLAAGGETGSESGGRLLEEENRRRLTDRQLDNGSFEPADDEAGVTVTFQNDPGNTDDTKKSGVLSFGSVLIGAIVLLSSYLL